MKIKYFLWIVVFLSFISVFSFSQYFFWSFQRDAQVRSELQTFKDTIQLIIDDQVSIYLGRNDIVNLEDSILRLGKAIASAYIYVTNSDNIVVGTFPKLESGLMAPYPWEKISVRAEGFNELTVDADFLSGKIIAFDMPILEHSSKELIGRIRVAFPFAYFTEKITGQIKTVSIIYFILSFFMTFITGSVLFFLLVRPIEKITELIKNRNQDFEEKRITINFRFFITEIDLLVNSLKQMILTIYENQALKRTLVVEQEKSRIYRQVSHDIKSPLAALKEVHRNIGNNSSDLFNLFDSALDKIKSIVMDLDIKAEIRKKMKFNINSLIVDTIKLKTIEIESHSKKISFVLNLSKEDAFVLGNKEDFYRIFSNIINNSVEAIQADGEVSVDTQIECERNAVRVMISDNGPGFHTSILNKLGKAELTYGKKSGQGLGLSNACKIIFDTDGSIFFENNKNKGAIVTIYLPLAQQLSAGTKSIG